jgi:periplasmic nitrate reductase NapE
MIASGHVPQPQNDALEAAPSKRRELTVFLVTTLVLIPGAAVAVVGGFGLIVWISQIVFGPPGPPA